MQEVLKKLEEHDKRFDDQDKRFDDQDKRFDEHDKRFDGLDKRLDEHDKRFDQIDRQIDFLVKKVLEHDERFERIEENMATRADISNMTNILDKLVKLAETKDQELTLIARGLRDVEDQVKINTKDIQIMKPLLGLS